MFSRSNLTEKDFYLVHGLREFQSLMIGKAGGEAPVSELMLAWQLNQEKKKMGEESEIDHNSQR